MRFLVISNSPLNEDQGSGYVIVNFCRKLRSRGHEVDLIGPDDYEVLKSAKKGRSYRLALGMLLACLRQLQQNKYDVIEFYGAESWLAATVLSLLPQRSFLLISHSNGLETYCNDQLSKYLGSITLDGDKPKWYQLNQNRLMDEAFIKVDGIIALSDCDRDYCIARNYKPPNRIVTVEGALADDYFGQKCDLERQQIIGFCGSWILRKGIRSIEIALSKILSEFPNARLKLFGVGDQCAAELKIPPHLLSQVEITSFAETKDDLRAIYRSVSIFIMPSLYEGYGLVAAEAMSCGCALVTTQTGIGYSLKNREEAIIVDFDAESLYSGIKELLLDDQLRKRIAHAGYTWVQSLRWQKAVDLLEATYTRWLTSYRSQSDF
jgi:glycosyltransferase involved in cell wall biosynthesis